MKLNKGQRSFVADKLMDSANYALALLVLGQLVSTRVQLLLLVLGLALYLWCWGVSIQLKKEVKQRAKS